MRLLLTCFFPLLINHPKQQDDKTTTCSCSFLVHDKRLQRSADLSTHFTPPLTALFVPLSYCLNSLCIYCLHDFREMLCFCVKVVKIYDLLGINPSWSTCSLECVPELSQRESSSSWNISAEENFLEGEEKTLIIS